MIFRKQLASSGLMLQPNLVSEMFRGKLEKFVILVEPLTWAIRP